VDRPVEELPERSALGESPPAVVGEEDAGFAVGLDMELLLCAQPKLGRVQSDGTF
jgi:hypothetical protein